MASDSLVSNDDHTAAAPVAKIWTTGGLLFGYSGHLSIREAIRKRLEGAFAFTPQGPELDPEMAASLLTVTVGPVVQEAYNRFTGGPLDNPPDKIGGRLVVIGRDSDGHWILEIDENNMVADYRVEASHAIGSAATLTQVGRRLLDHYKVPTHDHRHLCLLAYRTVQASIEVLGSAWAIGPPVQLWKSTADGFTEVSGTELDQVKDNVDVWKGRELDSLLSMFETEGEPAPESLPAPLGDGDPPATGTSV